MTEACFALVASGSDFNPRSLGIDKDTDVSVSNESRDESCTIKFEPMLKVFGTSEDFTDVFIGSAFCSCCCVLMGFEGVFVDCVVADVRLRSLV